MSKPDPRYAKLHKEVYTRFIDELDPAILKIIMNNPGSEEAVILNQRVESEIRSRLEALDAV